MKAEIISVGTELLLGHTVNSDATYIARELALCGIDLEHVQTVGDNFARLEEALRYAISRSQLVITSGGLGPTEDDLTKECVAHVAGLELIEDVKSNVALKEYFGSRPMSANQQKQALIPRGAYVFANSNGTAPGCAVPLAEGKYVLLLPGPPRELLPMLENEVRPFLLALCQQTIVSRMIKTFGIGEGLAAEKISDLLDSDNPTLAPYATDGEMFLRITAKADTLGKAKALLEPMAREIRCRLGDVVYGEDVPNLENVVVNELIRRKLSISTAESCTGGLLAERITSQPGASAIFGYGVISYANQAKIKLLGVNSKILQEHGAVSADTAQAMAIGIKDISGADLGVAITGIAGPSGGTASKPVGLVYIALNFNGKIWIQEIKPGGRWLGREWVRQRASSCALDLTRRVLLGLHLPQNVVSKEQ